MARLAGHFPVIGRTDAVHTAAMNPVGARAFDEAGNEYIYLKGVASVAVGTWVTYDELGLTTRAVTNGVGRVAVAMAAVVASTWGWFQIWGSAQGLALTGFADNGKVYLTSTDGSVDDADVSTNVVTNAVGRSAVNETTFLATFEIAYPFAQDVAID